MNTAVDTVWLIIATSLVILMQVGFLLLEGGRVRNKNSINVAQKNIADLMVAWIFFFAIGFFLMFGVAVPQAGSTSPTPLQFLFQLGFCATAASIVSGGIAERMTYRAYLALVVLIAGLLYPLVGRLVWGDIFQSETTAPLASLGFVDFSGATVVHALGGWVALGAILYIGPRTDRFHDSGRPREMPSSNSILTMQGALLLMLGWLGFNGGNISAGSPLLQSVLLNTLLCGAMGSLAGMLVGLHIDKGIAVPNRMINGMLGGLVAGSASIHLMDTSGAAWIGFSGGAVATSCAHWLLHKWRFDDPVDVVATHGIAGLFGTLAVPFTTSVYQLPAGSRLSQLGIQALGSITVLLLVTATSFFFLKLLSKFTLIRVSENDERVGLNYSEHGLSVGSDQLQRALEAKLLSDSSDVSIVSIDDSSEHSELVETLNALLKRQQLIKDKLAADSTRFRHFAGTASDWLWETDETLQLIFISSNNNGVDTKLADEAIGQHLLDVISLPRSAETMLHRLVLSRENIHDLEATLPLRLEDRIKLHVLLRGVPFFNSEGEFAGYRGTVSDITPQKAAERRAAFLAMHDDLTGLPNRRALAENLHTQVRDADSTESSVAVAALDLDGFKTINDSHGHAAGDQLLNQVAARISECLRSSDLVFRTGGDEFVILLAGLNCDSSQYDSVQLCERIINQLAKPFAIDAISVIVGTSIGLAFYPQQAGASKELTHMADMGLYEAKERGKGCVVVFEPSMDKDARFRSEMEADIKRALRDQEFYLLYQPILNARSLQIESFEALIRWTHPQRGEISPAGFIPLAEKLGLMNEIFYFVLESSCIFSSGWQRNADRRCLRFSINITSSQLSDPHLCENILRVLAIHSIQPEFLELELGTRTMLDNFDRFDETLKKLRSVGIKLVIDDFGKHDMPMVLSNLPIDKVKIDQELTERVLSNEKIADSMKEIVTRGKTMDLQIAAQGVEQDNQKQMLQSLGCDQLQGFLFSKPVTEHDVLEMLRTQNSNRRSA